MVCWHYIYAGLRVASELPIPEWETFAHPAAFAHADVHIGVSGAQPFLPTTFPKQQGGVAQYITAGEYWISIPEVACYSVYHGRAIVVTPAPGAELAALRLWLLGAAWGALCYQRGLLPLHASVVQRSNRAIAFCGASGAGKSSLAAGLLEHGWRLISDDLCRVEVAGGETCVYPAAPRLRLWRDALAALGRRTEGLTSDHHRIDKFHLPEQANSERPARPVRLHTIYLLAWGKPGVARLTGSTALRRLVAAATYHGELLAPMELTAVHWQHCIALAQSAPVYQFSRPRDWAAFDEALSLLIGHEEQRVKAV